MKTKLRAFAALSVIEIAAGMTAALGQVAPAASSSALSADDRCGTLASLHLDQVEIESAKAQPAVGPQKERLICAYPAEPVLRPGADPDKAASYSCRTPSAAAKTKAPE